MIYQKSDEESPVAGIYSEPLCRALTRQAAQTADPTIRLGLFRKAEDAIERGIMARPLNADLLIAAADMYLEQTLLESASRNRRAYATRSEAFLQRALQSEPTNFEILNKMAWMDLAVFGRIDEALDKLKRSLRIFPRSHQTLALRGDGFAAKGRKSQVPAQREELLRKAILNYEAALEMSGPRFAYEAALAKVYMDLENHTKALALYLGSRSSASQNEIWKVDEIIARLYGEGGNRDAALYYLQDALDGAPEGERDKLLQLQNQILSLR